MNFNVKSLLPYLLAVLAIVVCSSVYFSPVFQGKRLIQSDIVTNKAEAHEVREYREQGEQILWTSRVFSGMTTFNISADFNNNIILPIRRAFLSLPSGLDVSVVCSLGMFILLLVFRVNPWLAAIGALGYGLSSNLLSSLMAGHNSKVVSIGYLAPTIGSIVLVFRGRLLLGGALTALFVGLLIISNHFQIMYYFLLISILIGATYFVYAVREKTLPDFFKKVVLLVAAGLIGFLPNFSKVYNTREHSKETIRGGQKLLSSKASKDEGGLDRGYAMSWSHGLMETFSVVVPSVMGGSSQETLPEGGAVSELVGKQPKNRELKGPTYIGDQPFLQGTIYFGASFIFLFILSLFIVEARYKAWFIAIIILSFFIGWGKNWSWFTNFLFDYFPLYNKFRTPSMALAMAGLAIPALGIIGLSKIIQNKIDPLQLKNAFKWTLIASGGLMTFLLLYGITSDWKGPKDAGLSEPWNNPRLYEALLSDRQSLFMNDWLISTIIMAICAALVWLFTTNKLKPAILFVVLAVVTVGDNWRVSKRYLNDSSFKPEKSYAGLFQATAADQRILADPDPHHRVINLTVNPWTDGMTSYHHENVGGHHAAKIQRYQDLIENQLSSQIQVINKAVLQGPQGLAMNPQVSKSMTAYNMLNTKYYILQNSPEGVVQNPTACGNAWFVSQLKKVNTHDEEMAAISDIDPLQTAIVHEEFKDDLYNYEFSNPEASYIKLTDFKPDHLTYESQNSADGLGVFSEVFYTNGWHAYLDGEEIPIYRANYILRALKIPAGKHKIEMVFAPASYTFGESVSFVGSIIFVLFWVGLVFVQYKKFRKSNAPSEAS